MQDHKPYKSSEDYAISAVSDGRSKSLRWPFRLMEVGEFISVEDAAEHDNASCAYRYTAKKYGMSFVRKTVNGVLHIKRVS